MANETAGAVPAPGADAETGPVLALQNVYLKDCSYEAPNGPRMDGQWNPQINLDLHTGVNIITPELREIVLTVTVSAKQGGFPQFLLPPVNFEALYERALTDACNDASATKN